MILLKEIVKLNENPHYDQSKSISSKYLDTHIINIIKNIPFSLVSDNIYKTDMINKYGQIVYFYAIETDTNYDILAGTAGYVARHDNKELFICAATKKYDSSFASAALKLYSWISKNTETKYLMTDEIHSTQSKIN